MKKNYLFPVTEKSQVESCFAICGTSGGGGTDAPEDGPFTPPTGGGWGAPRKQA